MTQLNGQHHVLSGPPSGDAPAPEPTSRHDTPQSWLAHKVLPFTSSLAVHAAVFMLAVVAAKVMIQSQTAIPKDLSKEQTVIPISTLSRTPGGMVNVGESNPFTKMSQEHSADDATPEGLSAKRGPSLDLVSARNQGDSATPLVLGAGRIGPGKNGEIGGARGGGNGDNGLPAIFGPGPGGGIGPRNPIFGPGGGNVRRIVFVCDASGSMLNKMATLKDELSKAVQGLSFVQSFNIIFFHDESFVTLDGNQLVAATAQAKRSAAKFLDDVVPAGTTNPIRGLELAFRQNPQLIYLLTDGDFPDNKAVLDKIHELNKGNKVRINTIAFVNDSDTDKAFRDLLKQVADESGGTFRDVNENQLGQ
jgi:hypothetical protein